MNKKYTLEIVAGDFNSPLARNEIWTSAFFKFPELLGVSRVILGIACHQNKIDYLDYVPSWEQCHAELKAKILADHNYIEELIDKFISHGQKMNQWTEENFLNADLQSLSGEELFRRLKIFSDLQSTEYAIGVALVILDFQGFSFVENNLDKIFREKLPEKDRAEYYRVFTQPINNSFAQDQEEDLLRLMEKYYPNKNWQEDIKDKSRNEIEFLYPEFYSDLKNHTQKYCWVYYVYAGPAFTEQNFLDFVKDYLLRGINPGEQLKLFRERKEKLLSEKDTFLAFLKPTEFERMVLNLAAKVVWAKPRRKDFQSKSYYHAEKLYREIGRRLFLSLDQVRSCTQAMLEKGLRTGELDGGQANELYNLHVCFPNDNGEVDILSGQEAQKFIDTYVKKAKKSQQVKDVKEIIGTCACPGKASGKVKIINRVTDLDKMNYGDILVSLATTPSIVSAMKKAAAIITDEGGLTCHASIVSRELNIPCVIGTKFATQVFRDGDKIAVDATNGRITIL